MSRPVDMARVLAAEQTIAEALALRPDLAGRTAAFLSSDPDAEALEEPMADRFDKPTQIRLDADILTRADALVPFVASKPEFQAIGRVTRASVLRLAMLRGLAELEAEGGKGTKPRKKS